jgi:GAF domain-containing protein
MSFLARVRDLLGPPVFEGDEDKTRVARWTNLLLWIELGLVVVSSAAIPLTGSLLLGGPPIGVIVLLCVVGLLVLHAGRVQFAAGLFVTSLWLIATALSLFSGGISDQGVSSYFMILVTAGLLLGGRAVIGFAALSALACVALFYADVAGVLPPNVMASTGFFGLSMLISNLVMIAAVLNLFVRGMGDALVEARRAARDLREQGRDLESLVDERTRELNRRSAYLGATTAIAREAAAVLGDPQRLLDRAVEVVGERFGFYHVGIFAIDPSGQWAELQAASSEGGRRMLARGHRLRVGEQGIVGSAAAAGTYRLAMDVGQDAAFFDNPDLPETRSEVALPLRAREQVIGVLDVQSAEPEAFADEDVGVLQALADQMALAVSSARLFRQVEESAEAERRARGELGREAWRALLSARPDLGYRGDRQHLVPIHDLPEPEVADALQRAETTLDAEEGKRLAIPLRVGGQVIGVVHGVKGEAGRRWTQDEIAILEALSEQLSVAAERARLYRETQRSAARERAIGQVTGRIRQSLDLETMLRTAASEMRETMGLDKIVVRLATPETVGGTAEPSGGSGR